MEGINVEYIITIGILFLIVTVVEMSDIRKKKITCCTHDTSTSNARNIASTKKCPSCKAEMDNDAIKCKNCGALINFLNGSYKT